MNYITEIKLFYDWLETHKLSTGSIALWHSLIHIANKSNWSTPLSIPTSILMLKTGLSRSALYRARMGLEKYDLIVFSARGGCHSALYKLRSLEVLFCHSNTHSRSKETTKTNTPYEVSNEE